MRIVKRVLLILIVIIGLTLFVLGARWAAQQIALRPLDGGLAFDAAALPSALYDLGGFQVAWDADQGALTITHNAQPERVLWSTRPGRSFAAAAIGQETVTDSRGHFTIDDRLLTRCADQTIDSMALRQDVQPQLMILGELACGNGQTVPYAMTLARGSQIEEHLDFQLGVADPAINRAFITYTAEPDERFFGFGAQFSTFDLKGRRLPILVTEQGVGRGLQPLTAGANLTAGAGGAWHTTYAPAPHYISSRLRSLVLANHEYSIFDMRRPDQVQVQVFAPNVRGSIIYGASPAELISSYTGRTGRMRPLPDWMISGAIVGMQGGTDRVREVWQQMQDFDTPLAGFWLQDWVGQRTTDFGQRLWWNWELDQEHYPGWEQLVADLNAAGVGVLTYVNPFLVDVADKPNARRNLFREAAERGYLVKNQAGEPYMLDQGGFEAALVDLTNREARWWLLDVLATEVLGAGAWGWMADFGEGLPFDAVLSNGEDPAAAHNRYPEDWAMLNQEALMAAPGGGDLVFFTRSGFRSSPNFSTLFWLGDQLVSWDEHDGMKTAVTGLLSSGLSGFSLNHSDIGGYTTILSPLGDYTRSQELLLRWMELNAFTTVFRSHEGNRPADNVQVYSNAETLAHFSRMAQVYAAWLPYRQQLVQEAAATGLPVVRHPFIHYPDDPQVLDLNYQQFMVGSEFMVAPVLDPGVNQAEVYLPAGRWVHVWSGQVFGDPAQGQRVQVAAPLGQPAVFFREGSAAGQQFVDALEAAGLLAQPGAE